MMFMYQAATECKLLFVTLLLVSCTWFASNKKEKSIKKNFFKMLKCIFAEVSKMAIC